MKGVQTLAGINVVLEAEIDDGGATISIESLRAQVTKRLNLKSAPSVFYFDDHPSIEEWTVGSTIFDATAKSGYTCQCLVVAAIAEILRNDERYYNIGVVDSDTHGGPADGVIAYSIIGDIDERTLYFIVEPSGFYTVQSTGSFNWGIGKSGMKPHRNPMTPVLICEDSTITLFIALHDVEKLAKCADQQVGLKSGKQVAGHGNVSDFVGGATSKRLDKDSLSTNLFDCVRKVFRTLQFEVSPTGSVSYAGEPRTVLHPRTCYCPS
eukprot:COSAG06_NODE_4917_length_3859_cov_2.785638_2_plen_266_part_00